MTLRHSIDPADTDGGTAAAAIEREARDEFTTAARAEAEKTWPKQRHGVHVNPSLIRDEMVRMAVWARAHLAAQEDDGHDGWCGCGCQDAQEPTDAEVEAAANAILAHEGETEETAHLDLIDAAWDHARAALVAARNVGKAEEGSSCRCDLTGSAPPAVHIVDRHEEGR